MIDSKIPFTCRVTEKYCGAETENIYIQFGENVLKTIAISNDLSKLVNKRLANKIERFIIKELRNLMKD